MKNEQQIAMANFLDNKAYFNWKFYCTGTTRYTLSFKLAEKIMENYYNELKELDNNIPRPKIFFAAEPYDLKEGCHIHYLVECGNSITKKNLHDIWQKVANNKTKQHKTSISNYEYGKGGAFYLSKYICKPNAEYNFIGIGSE